MSVAPQMHEHVAGVVGAGHQLLGEGVDRAAAHQRAGAGQAVEHPARRVDAAHDRPAARPASVPASAASAASHPTKSNSGWAVIAVAESMAPRPHSAWLATAWAGQ